MLLSVIVPVYNVEKYLNKCIESLINQTFTDFELILVNDGSTDNSGVICNLYQLKDSRIKVINKKNGGLSSARNIGLEIAKGEYICFIDSDDWVRLDMFEIMLNSIIESNCDMAICEFEKYYEGQKVSAEVEVNNSYSIVNKNDLINQMYTDKRVLLTVSWNKVYKKSIFSYDLLTKQPIKFPLGKIHEDEYTTYKLINNCNRICLVNNKLYYYRQNPNSIMGRKFNINRLDILGAIKERIEYAKLINNIEFYNNSRRFLCYQYFEHYFMCKKYLQENLELVKKMNVKSKKIAKELIKSDVGNYKDKIKWMLFIINPNLYKISNNILSRMKR